ncbi:peptidylprolyl isomerase [Archangium lipolyticum]|uniref:peptidylprolyl isomerase n=1 Tax=Archangium lipolyticum TaxID=2970465 RepID=UPI00214A77D9|nr:peptidylprolyl isomerase [Archangium lipolyticum]
MGPNGSRAGLCSVTHLLGVSLCLLLLPLTGVAGSASLKRLDLPENESIAEVNGQQVSLERFNALWAINAKLHRLEDGRVPDSRAVELKINIAEQLIDEVLIEQAAEQAQVFVEPHQVDAALDAYKERFPNSEAFEKHVGALPLGLSELRRKLRLEQLRERLLSLGDVPSPSDRHLRFFYENHLERFRAPSTIAALEIFLKVESDTSTEAVRAKRQKAEELRRQALQSDASFEELAKKKLEGVEASSSGILKVLKPHDVAPESWLALAGMRPGTISPVVRTEKGFHVFKLVSQGPSSIPPFEDIKPVVAVEMKSFGRELRRSVFLKQLRANAIIVNVLAERYALQQGDGSRGSAGIRHDGLEPQSPRSSPQPVLEIDASTRPR